MRLAPCFAIVAATVAGTACSTYLDDLNRAETHVTANEHERALALFRVNERDLESLTHANRIRYCYLRGMNDYRLGGPFRPDARYWLGLARALEKEKPGGLRPEWKERLEDALTDLNQDVHGTGSVGNEGGESAKKGESKAVEQDNQSSNDSLDHAPKPKDRSKTKD